MTLRIHLLGPAEIRRDGESIAIPGHRPLALLAYLLISGKTHTRQHLVDILFEGPDDPRAALRWNLSKLRGAIGSGHILADRREIAFNFESDYWLDVIAFESGQTELYRGDFLEGLYVRDAFRFEDWLFFERERLRSHYQAAMTRQLAQDEQQGDYAAVVETGHRLLRLDNLREDWYRALMRGYARLGKREAALAQYAQCQQVLQAELGVEPVSETVALADAIEGGYLQPEVLEVAAPATIERGLTIKPAPQVLSPASLVGRAEEMAALHQVWQRVREGTGQIVLVEGEPGIGKTRLIEELLTEVSGQATVLRAKCPELETPLAYTLFVDPLRKALARDRPPGLTDIWLAEVSRLLPELQDRYPNLPQPAQLDPEAERRRLFDAVCATLLSFTKAQPLVLFLDDLQWADLSSFELVNHLSNWISEAPVLIIGAYRPHEVETVHPLRRASHTWRRAGLLTRLALDALSETAVAELLQELTTWRGDDPSFADFIYRETAGNPLFVVEMVASLRDEGRLPQSIDGWPQDFQAADLSIPAQVQMIVEARLNRLDELSRQVLTAAAVIRGSFQVEVLQTVSGRGELETLESLERLLTNGLLVEQGEDYFTFSHHKIRQVAYAGLSQLRRKLLHRRVAEALATQYRGQVNGMAGRLAYHYEQAGNWNRALDCYLQAGHAAREQYAHETAIGHYQKALTLLKEQGDYERAARTLMQLGLTFHNAFDFQQARQAYEEGFALWQKAGQVQLASPLASTSHTLRLVEGDPPTLDPTLAGDAASVIPIAQLFNGLVETSPEMDVIPDIAQSWEVLEEGRKYIFHLRTDVRWSDGVAVTAEDFEYAWKRALAPTTGSLVASLFYDIKGARAFHRGEKSDPDCVRVQALDTHTLVVELEEPTGYFLQLVAHYVFYPVPRHVVETYGHTWTAVEHIVTNGPFRLEEWNPGESIVLARNPEYHGRSRGNVHRVELSLRTDWSAWLEMYELDELDVLADNLDILGLPPVQMDRVRQQHAEEYISGPLLVTCFVCFDTSRPPFNDPRVRRAFVLATDREMLADVVLRGYMSPATGGFVPPWMPGHSAGVGLPHNPKQAQQLLAAAGYPSGRDFPIIDGLLTPSPVPPLIGQYLQTQWQDNLGVKINWEALDWTSLLAKLYKEPPRLHINMWLADYADPDNFLRVCFQQMSMPIGWWHEAYNNLVKEARRATDQDQRMKLYQQADKILVEEAAIMPLAYGRRHLLMKPWVRQFPTSPIRSWFWKDVIIEAH